MHIRLQLQSKRGLKINASDGVKPESWLNETLLLWRDLVSDELYSAGATTTSTPVQHDPNDDDDNEKQGNGSTNESKHPRSSFFVTRNMGMVSACGPTAAWVVLRTVTERSSIAVVTDTGTSNAVSVVALAETVVLVAVRPTVAAVAGAQAHAATPIVAVHSGARIRRLARDVDFVLQMTRLQTIRAVDYRIYGSRWNGIANISAVKARVGMIRTRPTDVEVTVSLPLRVFIVVRFVHESDFEAIAVVVCVGDVYRSD